MANYIDAVGYGGIPKNGFNNYPTFQIQIYLSPTIKDVNVNVSGSNSGLVPSNYHAEARMFAESQAPEKSWLSIDDPVMDESGIQR